MEEIWSCHEEVECNDPCQNPLYCLGGKSTGQEYRTTAPFYSGRPQAFLWGRKIWTPPCRLATWQWWPGDNQTSFSSPERWYLIMAIEGRVCFWLVSLLDYKNDAVGTCWYISLKFQILYSHQITRHMMNMKSAPTLFAIWTLCQICMISWLALINPTHSPTHLSAKSVGVSMIHLVLLEQDAVPTLYGPAFSLLHKRCLRYQYGSVKQTNTKYLHSIKWCNHF